MHRPFRSWFPKVSDNSSAIPDEAIGEDTAASPDQIEVTEPVYFQGPAGPLFGWHHLPATRTVRSTAIVVCPPFGSEYVSTHHVIRALAVELARLGFPVLRFDYHGTGDSAGAFGDSGPQFAWVGSIGAAIDESRRRSGCSAVSVVGMRLGAALAVAAAAERGDVDSLVLWCPVRSGRTYIRELRALSATLATSHQGDPRLMQNHDSGEAWVEAAGFAFSSRTVSDLEELKPAEISIKPARRVLMVERNDMKPDDKLANHLSGLGTITERVTLGGYVEMMQMPLLSVQPVQMVEAITDWLDSVYPENSTVTPAARLASESSAIMPAQGSDVRIREEAVRFGTGERLFGIMVESGDGQRPELPAVLMLNTGGDHHIGPHRLYVPLAREWATHGFSVLRMDIDGLGDSGVSGLPVIPDGYPDTAMRDVAEAIDYLRDRRGKADVVAMGMCSGAYHSIQAAREGLPLAGVIAINAPLYYRPGDPFDAAAAQVLEAKRVRMAFSSPSGWAKVAGGKSDLRYNVQTLWSHAKQRIARRMREWFGGARSGRAGGTSPLFHPSCETLLIYSRSDGGLFFLETQGAAQLRKRGRKNFRLDVVDGPDHTFSTLAWQRHLSKVITSYLRETFG